MILAFMISNGPRLQYANYKLEEVWYHIVDM